QDWSHFGYSGANRVPLLPKDIPEDHREFVWLIVQSHLARALHKGILALAHHCNSRQVSLNVGGKDRYPCQRKLFCKNLQSDGFPGACGTSNQAMAITKLEIEYFVLMAFADHNRMCRGRRGSGGRFLFC